MTFEIWMQQVNTHFINTTGLHRDSFPDNTYHDMYVDGLSPHDAMVDTIENEYGQEGLEAFGLEL